MTALAARPSMSGDKDTTRHMSDQTYDHRQLSAISLAAKLVAEAMGAVKEKDKLIVARAVFDIAAETMTFDTNELVEMARERLTPRLGWKFA